jgi:hypothetical protein
MEIKQQVDKQAALEIIKLMEAQLTLIRQMIAPVYVVPECDLKGQDDPMFRF